MQRRSRRDSSSFATRGHLECLSKKRPAHNQVTTSHNLLTSYLPKKNNPNTEHTSFFNKMAASQNGHHDTSEFLAGLEHLRVRDVWPYAREIASLYEQDTVAHALQVLTEMQILSAPVYRGSRTDGSDPAVIGVFDVMDVALFTVGVSPKDINWEQMSTGDMTKMLQTGEHFETSVVADVLALKRAWKIGYQHDFVFDLDTPLSKIIEAFHGGVHRVLIANESNALHNMISQTDMADILGQVMALMDEELRTRPVSSVAKITEGTGLMDWKLHTAAADKPAIRVLTEDMNATSTLANFSAVPLTGPDGKIVATLSSSNLLGVNHRTFDDLGLPALAFVTRRDFGAGTFRSALSAHKSLHPITCTPDEHLQDVLSRMISTHVHRIWVVDSDKKPIGVISYGDMFKAFMPIGQPRPDTAM